MKKSKLGIAATVSDHSFKITAPDEQGVYRIAGYINFSDATPRSLQVEILTRLSDFILDAQHAMEEPPTLDKGILGRLTT